MEGNEASDDEMVKQCGNDSKKRKSFGRMKEVSKKMKLMSHEPVRPPSTTSRRSLAYGAHKPYAVFPGRIQLFVVDVSTGSHALKVGKNSPRCATIIGARRHPAFTCRNTNQRLTRDFALLANFRG
ncbi:hypothetical protein J6590_093712 [Homalodisca vitripennis]|nr:hypothetical protein J6590_093712 [Homalodisca vitripennis]